MSEPDLPKAVLTWLNNGSDSMDGSEVLDQALERTPEQIEALAQSYTAGLDEMDRKPRPAAATASATAWAEGTRGRGRCPGLGARSTDVGGPVWSVVGENGGMGESKHFAVLDSPCLPCPECLVVLLDEPSLPNPAKTLHSTNPPAAITANRVFMGNFSLDSALAIGVMSV